MIAHHRPDSRRALRRRGSALAPDSAGAAPSTAGDGGQTRGTHPLRCMARPLQHGPPGSMRPTRPVPPI
jgi:hypothetical protein